MSNKPEIKKARPKKTPAKAIHIPAYDSKNSIAKKSIHGINLNTETARKAIILSEIIGPPAAKRRRRR